MSSYDAQQGRTFTPVSSRPASTSRHEEVPSSSAVVPPQRSKAAAHRVPPSPDLTPETESSPVTNADTKSVATEEDQPSPIQSEVTVYTSPDDENQLSIDQERGP